MATLVRSTSVRGYIGGGVPGQITRWPLNYDREVGDDLRERAKLATRALPAQMSMAEGQLTFEYLTLNSQPGSKVMKRQKHNFSNNK